MRYYSETPLPLIFAHKKMKVRLDWIVILRIHLFLLSMFDWILKDSTKLG